MGKTFKYSIVKMSELPGLDGMTDLASGEVKVISGQSKEEKLRTDIHEFTHCGINRVGLGQVLSHETIEMICEMCSNVFPEIYKMTMRKFD